MNAVAPKGSYGNELWVFYASQKVWLLSDLHQGNIRRLPDGKPTIIDALVGELSNSFLKMHSKLAEAAAKAKALSLGLTPPSDDPFLNVRDDEL